MNFRSFARWRSHLIAATAALVGLWLLGWLALPWGLKPLIQQQASEALGRQVTVAAVEVHPWSLTLTLRDLRVASADAQGTQLSVARASVNASLSSVLRWAPVLDAVTVEHPVLHLTHLGRGQLDVQDILDRLNPPDAPHQPDTGPPRMALYNMELLGGELTLRDGAQEHRVSDLNLTVPFIDTLGSARALRTVRVQPRLSFKLNDSPFDTAAQTQPFDDNLNTQATLKVADLDLSPYLGYLPQNLPARPTRALLGADLKLSFQQLPTPTVVLSGSLSARDLAVNDADGQPLLALRHAQVTLADVRPLQRVVELEEIALDAPHLHLRRGADGQLSFANKPIAENPINTSDKDQKNPKNTPAAWTLGLQRLSITRGQVAWQDEHVGNGQRPVRLAMGNWQLQASQLHWPLPTDAAQASRVDSSATLASGLPASAASAGQPANAAAPARRARAKPPAKANPGGSPAQPAQLNLTAQVLASGADLRLTLQGLDLPWLAPYVATHFSPTVQGQVDMDGRLTWRPASAETPLTPTPADGLTLALDTFTLRQLRLTPAASEGQPLAAPVSLERLAVTGASVQPLARRAQLGRIQLTRPQLPVQRLANGQWQFEQWLTAPPATSTSPPAVAATAADKATAAAAPPWDWQLAELRVTDGQLAWRDDSPAQPVALQASGLQLSLQGLSARSSQPASLSTSLKLATAGGDTEPGSLDWRGTLTLGTDGQTPQVAGQLTAQRLPAHALAPYAAAQVQLQLLRADASYRGHLSWASSPSGPRLQLAGDATLEDVRADTLPQPATDRTPAPPAEPLLRWKTLHLKGLDLQLAPASPLQLSVQSGAVADFFARIAILPNGRINLQDILAAASPATAGADLGPTASPPPLAPATGAANAPIIRMGPFSLVHGEVDFSDAYIRPNYQARLSDLTGRLGGFASQPAQPTGNQAGQAAAPEMAELQLKGRAEGTASLDISGRINPLAKPLALDIEGRVRDLELPALSPYAVKYTGHGIERGKLSLDVAYTVQPDGQLTARNQLVLNRLTFGDAVPDAPASLPVKLAVALLADRQGVIDLHLPVQGSLNDPEFQLMPVLFKVLGNLLAKAATAPFSLLANALGGDADEWGSVAFVPGTAQLAPASEATLARLAQALADRPRLALTVAGSANLAAERDAYQRARLDEQLLAEASRSENGQANPPATMDPATRQHWLNQLYRRTNMPKPRNALGLPATLSPADMQALLLTQIPVTEATMRTLATQRAVAVRDALVRLKVPAQRLYTANPQLEATATPGPWQPSAQLTLSVP